MKERIIEIIGFVVIIVIAIVLIWACEKWFYKLTSSNSDDLEIEKKWLILEEDIPYDLDKADKYEIEQTYLNFNPEMRVRNINNGQMYVFTLKRDTEELGLTREEYEIVINEEEYNNLLKKKEGNTIYKTRYQLDDENGLTMAFDIFSGDLTGLAYMEIEFENEKMSREYGDPEWVKEDVTRDLNYKNGHLARYGIPATYDEDIK